MAGGSRILPFLGASVAVHMIAIGAFGTDPLNVSVSSRGSGHEVSIRLEAAAPAATNSNVPKEQAESQISPEQAATATESTSSPAESQAARAIATASRPEPAPNETHRAERTVAENPNDAADTPEENAESRETAASNHALPRDAERVARVEESATGSASVTSELTRAEAREALVAEVAKYFHYPRLAQRRGWEGTVVLSVRILPDGRLDGIRVVRSSGRALLDQSAAGSLGHVRRLPEFANRIGSSGLALEIPVTYRLESA